jgi:hypothetical protein
MKVEEVIAILKKNTAAKKLPTINVDRDDVNSDWLHIVRNEREAEEAEEI